MIILQYECSHKHTCIGLGPHGAFSILNAYLFVSLADII